MNLRQNTMTMMMEMMMCMPMSMDMALRYKESGVPLS